ncbi:hypothetical protein LCGC14_1031310 [marine sediment metagenome]|uniref:Uncharacterized protein n=1 Tax=marine sediment metagenome TaxID=412755 RepID=A0A0F9QCK4_9ZZZZ
MILSIEGDEATGKTTLAYSAPLPIVGFAFDMGIERAIKGGKYEELFAGLHIKIVSYVKEVEWTPDVWKDQDITIFELPNPIQLDSMRLQGNTALWLYAINAMAAAFSDPEIATIVVDTMTVARRTKASSHLENLQNAAYDSVGQRIQGVNLREQLIQIEYGKINDAIRDIYTTGAGVKKNLIATHHLTDERKAAPGPDGRIEQQLTGEKILEGLAQTHRFVDVAIRTSKERGKINGELLKCGYNLGQEGTVMANPTWDSIANLIAMGTGDRIEIGRRNHN